MVHGLHKTRHRHAASGFQQESQLVEVLFRALAALLLAGHGDKHGPFGNFFVCDKVAHFSQLFSYQLFSYQLSLAFQLNN